MCINFRQKLYILRFLDLTRFNPILVEIFTYISAPMKIVRLENQVCANSTAKKYSPSRKLCITTTNKLIVDDL